MKKYDIIGDIHGCARELASLLRGLDYEEQAGYYKHPERIAVFLGDFIDRGPEQRKTLSIVRPMIDNGAALSVMGNHEFNAICYATKKDNSYLREHSQKNTNQHQAFLEEFPAGTEEYNDVINWFKTLPIYLDLGNIGIVHACWCTDSFRDLQGLIDNTNRLSDEAFLAYSDHSSSTYEGLEKLLKGPEHELPPELYFNDKDGNLRKNARISWWLPEAHLPSERLEFGGQKISQKQEDLLNSLPSPRLFPLPDKLVFVGHYWLRSDPAPLSNKVACVDYSVAKGGKLVCYRYNGENTIDSNNFFWM